MPYKNLTDEQLEAVRYNGNLLLSACPGSGKTKTLVSKLYYTLENDYIDIGKKKLIVLTYTNIAADTISERLNDYGCDNKSLWIGTIHSFCLQWIIKPNINKISRLHHGYIIIDEQEKEVKIAELKDKYNLGYFERVDTKLNLNYKPIYNKNDKQYKLVMDYHRYLYNNKMIDFDLILNISYKLISESGGIANRLGKLIHHIYVDECQDISELQYEILKLIINGNKTYITLIGDKEQAIYTGLGAIVKSAYEIKSFFGLDKLKEKNLTGCFRSSQRIIDFYKKYKDDNNHIKSISSISNFESVVCLNNDIDKSQLANYISGIINTHLKQGIKESDIVILCPSSFDVINISKQIGEINNSFSIDGFLISPIPKNTDNIWLHLIRLLLIEPKMENYIKRKKIINDFHNNLIEESHIDNEINQKKLLKLINSISKNTEEDIIQWIDIIINDFCRMLSISLLEGSSIYNNKISLINATRERMKKYNMQYKVNDLKMFFSKASGIKITTCHSTKGDEYDVVICIGLLKGKIPNWNDIKNSSIEHQNYVARRLLYVIGSRAKKHLYMISEKGHKTKSGFEYEPTLQL